MSDPRPHPGPPRRARLPLWALFSMVIWGGSFVASRQALDSLAPLTLVAARFLLGAALLGLVLRARGDPFLPPRPLLGRCALLGLIFAAHVALQAYGLRLTTASHSGWIVAFTPVVIAIGARLFLGERLPLLGWLGVALGMAGVLCVSLDSVPALVGAQRGDLLQFCSCFTWATYTLVSVPAVRGAGALRVAAISLGVGALAALPGAAFELVCGAPEPVALVAALPEVLYLGLLASGLATAAWGRAQVRYGPQRSAAALYLQPFVTLVLAWKLRGDRIGASAILGGVLVLSGVAFVARSKRPR